MKKFVILSAYLMISSLGLLGMANASESIGFTAFKENVHPFLRNGCVQCHSGNGPGPGHSVMDPLESYNRIKSYVDFSDIPRSKLVTKGGNGHCKDHGVDCNTTPEEIKAVLEKWWLEGESQAQVENALKTSAKPLPRDLPLMESGAYKTMSWDLGDLHDSLKGIAFQIEVQRFSVKTETTAESYRFRKPMITAQTLNGQAVQVKGLKILVNGVFDPKANAYDTLSVQTDGDLSSPFTLSQRPVVILAGQGTAEDRISLAFNEVNLTSPLVCEKKENFSEHMSQAIGGCQNCHSGQNGEATQRFNLSGTVDQICSQVLLRVSRNFVSQSPIIRYALGFDGHPVSNEQATELLRRIKAWSEVEAPINEF